MRKELTWLAAFTAVFAVCAACIFWGTWSLGFAPIMPDCPVSYPVDYVKQWISGWLETGKFVPDDIKVFLGSPYFWTELQYAFAAFMSALGLVYFLRGKGLSLLAAYGAGLLLAFSGYWFSLFSAGHLGWFRWMTYGVFAFGLIDRALERGNFKYWIFLGACVAWGSFYQPDLWLLFTVFTGVYFVFRSVQLHKFNWKGVLTAGAFFVVIGAPSFYSAIFKDLAGRDQQIAESSSAGTSKEDRWIFVTNWSMPPEDSLEFFIPRIHGDTSCPFCLSMGKQQHSGVTAYTGALGRPINASDGNYRQHSLYIGFITCLLALFGIRKAPFFAVAAVVFWLLSMGRYCEPVYRIVYHLPFGDYLRAPVKWHHLTEFCVVVLAGFGMEWLLQLSSRVNGGWARWLPHALALIVVIGVVDLVRVNRLYCVKQDVSREYTFVAGQQLNDPSFSARLRDSGAKIAGYYRNAACISLPRRNPLPSEERKPVNPVIVSMGIISLIGTIFALCAALVPRKEKAI